MLGDDEAPAERFLHQPDRGQRTQAVLVRAQQHHRAAIEMLLQGMHEALQAHGVGQLGGRRQAVRQPSWFQLPSGFGHHNHSRCRFHQQSRQSAGWCRPISGTPVAMARACLSGRIRIAAMTDLLDQTLGNLACSVPGATRVFRQYRLDFCCGGDLSLREAARRIEADPQHIADALLARNPTPKTGTGAACPPGS